jgi:SAM-dependent methyltransferase
MPDLPVPPLEMREAVGPTALEKFDNPSGDPVFPEVPAEAYDSVFDFGCGCGRIARQLIQQRDRPRAYLGIDLHRQLIDWATANLTPAAPGFQFRHHDVYYPTWNEGADKPEVAPFPTTDDRYSLILAWSVFTHLTQVNAEYYLGQIASILRPDGFFLGTWFLFDKIYFPMMQEFQNALYINDVSPTNAVIFDRRWLVETAASKGLVVTGAGQPECRGFQWTIKMVPAATGAEPIELPPDEAPLREDGIRAAAVQPDLREGVRAGN